MMICRVVLGAMLLLAACSAEISENICREQAVGQPLCPELFLLGVQKSASTAFYYFLVDKAALDIRVPKKLGRSPQLRKEPHYFNLLYEKGFEWYINGYGLRKSMDELAIDASPDYTAHPLSAERIKDSMNFERLRFIIIFREPVDRAYSWYRHCHSVGLKYPNYDTAFRSFDYKFSLMAKYTAEFVQHCVQMYSEPELVFPTCAHRSSHLLYEKYSAPVEETGMNTTSFQVIGMIFTEGLYGYIMSLWFHYFEPNQFCVLIYDNIVQDARAELERIRPCLNFFGKEPVIGDDDVRLPKANVKICENCPLYEELDEEAMGPVRRNLNERLYAKSNQLLRSLLKEHNLRDSIIEWENIYN
uniref:Sulfotransferase domain-containing protein n=2 Tax=Rhodosorus marinus TaxID=101924 RepID=A0A7S3E8F2_9RHOD|mmetsp:Transcript_16231/g.67193  ORF Transcript_16231/g.67193 Transcript_16231/m.67193 type:complete len:359 (+) Transcript_16231:399-1475(+)|eukprot:CAMPEP_0113964688 /NCGR_PEP_ID=MMETSP0011_2-20120614/7296_1 /TAXON_ID=101924 /ORGANISM="Rhodosorus marinus" /LENGTH=358 /DNA_ID=CAMNT_0000977053 /DNA_START=381 /DNA_END=1457 /DNA_ORIENTATION=- /assembly_acc=CAM_ASM_000156